MSEYSISKKDLIAFFMVTFGLTIGMGFVMALVYPKYTGYVFTQLQMYYPTIGVITAMLLNNEKRKRLPMKFYGTYLFFTITSIVFLLTQIFVIHEEPGMHMDYWIILGSITCLLMCSLPDEKEKMNDFGLDFGKNVNSSISYIMLFYVLYICVNFLSSFIFGITKEFINHLLSAKTLGSLLRLPLLFPFHYIAFLGEEYGWRYFLQPALQERIGKRKGIILLGFIWGIWHLPINLFNSSYNLEISLYAILSQLIVCICYAIFFGLVYMNTENIWAISMIHLLNNYLSTIFHGKLGGGSVPVLLYLICMSIVYIPFLFTKEYRKHEEKTDITNRL